jgi:phospholipid/cholesterol/gamma-HCH transport system substrate-binding protein
MENKQSYVLVGAITLGLLLALFGFVLWLGQLTGEEKKEYDIFYKQSVAGLATGSPVQFGGVPVGQIKRIALMPESPEFVRVRISVEESVPILDGTTAAIEGVGFTGVSQIQLTGAMRGQQPLTAVGPYGVPVIPAKASGLGDLLASAPQVLERVSTLLAKLNDVFDDQNRASLAGILKNVNTTTEALANRKSDIEGSIVELRKTLISANLAAEQITRLAGTANRLLDSDGRSVVADLKKTLATANRTMARIDTLTANAEPGLTAFTSQTLPEVNRLVLDLRDATGKLGAVAAKLDEDPAGAIIGGRTLPDYKEPK